MREKAIAEHVALFVIGCALAPIAMLLGVLDYLGFRPWDDDDDS